MKKKRKKGWIRQVNFNDNPNGYFGYSDGDYDTCVNMDEIGLDDLDGELNYNIR